MVVVVTVVVVTVVMVVAVVSVDVVTLVAVVDVSPTTLWRMLSRSAGACGTGANVGTGVHTAATATAVMLAKVVLLSRPAAANFGWSACVTAASCPAKRLATVAADRALGTVIV
jgi:hypothetical protein